jgi:4-aminobutyrate aminotransferase-like enzyme
LKALQELAHKHGALLIVDEAQTGFGRTGKWFAIEHHDVTPDILTLSKSVGNGYPVAAVATTADIADHVTAKGLWNLSSHQSDPLAAAAVSAVIDIVRSERLVDRARETGEYFMERLRFLSSKQPAIGGIRGQGLMIGFDWLPQNVDKERHTATTFMFNCRRRGLHLTYGYNDLNVRIIPPLVITRAEIDFAVQVMEDAAKDTLEDRLSDEVLLPCNRYTRRLLVKQRRWRRILNYCWRSSPEQWVHKARSVFSSTEEGT